MFTKSRSPPLRLIRQGHFDGGGTASWLKSLAVSLNGRGSKIDKLGNGFAAAVIMKASMKHKTQIAQSLKSSLWSQHTGISGIMFICLITGKPHHFLYNYTWWPSKFKNPNNNVMSFLITQLFSWPHICPQTFPGKHEADWQLLR